MINWRACSKHINMRNGNTIFIGKPERMTPLRRPIRRREDNIKWILNTLCGNVWTGFNWRRTEPRNGSCEYNNEPWGSIKGDEFLD